MVVVLCVNGVGRGVGATVGGAAVAIGRGVRGAVNTQKTF